MLSQKKALAIDELRLGMYVVELDRPWVGTDFAFQGFPITSHDQIEQLRAYCRSVFVDPERETWAPEMRGAAPFLGTTIYTDTVPVESELGAARAIYRTCEHSLEQVLATVRSEGELDATLLTAAMSGMVASMQRSPAAMLLLNALRRRSSHELARAMDTSILMVAFGRFLQYPAPRLEVLGLAGGLLDVGMTMLPEYVNYAAGGDDALDDAVLESHVLHSVELIRSARGLPPGVDQVVIEHHERQDGEGYPYGLSSDQISADGAIAAIIDSFSRLTSRRSDVASISASRALSLLHKQRGSAVHEGLVEQFIQCIGVYPIGAGVELNTGEAGLVIAQNPVRRLLPRVMVMRDASGAPLTPHWILDLMKGPLTPSGEPYRIQRALPRHQLHIGPEDLLGWA